jgi:hypothetical protein
MQSLSLTGVLAIYVTIALLMVVSGLEKRKLVWKAGKRCPVCGRNGRHLCTPRL